jgi:hypothetical protein
MQTNTNDDGEMMTMTNEKQVLDVEMYGDDRIYDADDASPTDNEIELGCYLCERDEWNERCTGCPRRLNCPF